jgi:hypothetical protein
MDKHNSKTSFQEWCYAIKRVEKLQLYIKQAFQTAKLPSK